jgi:hypothetical protein
MAMGHIIGQTVVFIKEIGIKIKYQDMVLIIGMTIECTKDIGLIIICMVKENINGQMVVDMKVSM